ncbi:MAG: LPXTG cell wall anchor domain-containing protein, partial [Aeromicrobium sp.]|uniref:LPXTG cell wall anchor domain-containing protein n=1 Tax=Aeromicrobium sp. TaxID=1871063 RepID=UPI0039E365D4
PVAGFVGTPDPVTYLVDGGDGRTYAATITVTAVGAATGDEVTSSGDGPVVIDPLANDSVGTTLIPSSVRLVDPATGDLVTELVVLGVGRWVVDTTTGLITFYPVDGFTGEVPEVTYVVTGEDGLMYGASIALVIEAAAGDTTTVAGVLPGTGSGLSWLPVWAGLFLAVAGGLLIRRRRA